jgi:hypothetical protein
MHRIIFLLTFLLASCSSGKELKNAESQVAIFHAAFNESNFVLMYSLFTPSFKSKYDVKQFREEFSNIRNVYGKHERSTKPNRDVPDLNKNSLNITFSSMFEKSKVKESFTFVKIGSQQKIDSYSVELVSKRVNF